MRDILEIDKAIDNLVEESLTKSKTYSEALRYLENVCRFDELGQVIKKTAQDKIIHLALNRQI